MQKYQYIEVDDRYYCQQQSLLKLVRLFLFDSESCPDFIDSKVLLRLFLNKINPLIYRAKLNLPVFGCWGLRVHGGYKIFDPYMRIATKVFDDDIDDDLVRNEIRQHIDIGKYSFAPEIKGWNKEERWYQEEYLSGQSSYYFSPDITSEFMQIYYKDVAPCLLELIKLNKHRRLTIKEYIESRKTDIHNELNVLDQKDSDVANKIQKFYEYVLKNLDEHANEEIYLAFSHGDFHLFNLFKTETGMKLIDWEGIGEQSLLQDFFNYFFSHLWLGRTRDDFVEEIIQAIDDMRKRLAEVNAGLALSLTEKWQLYLMLYYFERIHAASTIFKQPPEYLLVWIDVYRNFEENRRHYAESRISE